ncbi:50S ribosomal protein L18 [Haloimpatiens sp. FM7315]|uniref:50S ribosomal protein L18 n=1 Tax=Haloimpatiens sp. FM7315 TaxID=3298609 RepID=UPI0035A29CE8
MFKKLDKKAIRRRSHLRVRKKVFGTPEIPRLCVYRSEKNIYAQIVDDISAVTLVAASTLDKAVEVKNGGNKEAAKLVGEMIAKKAVEKGIKNVVFDRGGYIYHGRVKELADAARAAGLQF